jgi:hypothetical protein
MRDRCPLGVHVCAEIVHNMYARGSCMAVTWSKLRLQTHVSNYDTQLGDQRCNAVI